MANINRYKVMLYGSSDGYQGNRAQIALYEDKQVVGFVRFHDEGMSLPDDEKPKDQIIMHLPSTMFAGVLDLLRNESPIELNFRMKRAFFGTSVESVGEGE